jgi:hypothetical protein
MEEEQRCLSEAREGSSHTQEVSAWVSGLRHQHAQIIVELFGYSHPSLITVVQVRFCDDFLDFTSVNLPFYMINTLPSRDYVCQ